MGEDAEKVGEEIASVITDAVETANANADEANRVAEVLSDAAMESERGRRIENVERDLGECLSNQAALSEAMAGMALRLEEMTGSLSTLLALRQSQTSPEATDQNEPEDGRRENPEPEAPEVTVIAPEAEAVQVPAVAPEPPARKRKRWI